MQGLVKKCQTCWRIHHITAQLVASCQILLPVPVQHDTGQILWQRSGCSNQEPHQRLDVRFVATAEPLRKAGVIAAEQARQAGLQLVQAVDGQRAFAQALLHHLQEQDHPLAAIQQEFFECVLTCRRQGCHDG